MSKSPSKLYATSSTLEVTLFAAHLILAATVLSGI